MGNYKHFLKEKREKIGWNILSRKRALCTKHGGKTGLACVKSDIKLK